jgi:hypothetical protein
VQAGHAALLHAHYHPGWWHDGYLVILAVPDEYRLWLLSQCLDGVTCFREPDLDGQLTAIAAGPSAGQLLRKLPLALSREGVRT